MCEDIDESTERCGVATGFWRVAMGRAQLRSRMMHSHAATTPDEIKPAQPGLHPDVGARASWTVANTPSATSAIRPVMINVGVVRDDLV